jgi:SAM-dependent methyltransferase
MKKFSEIYFKDNFPKERSFLDHRIKKIYYEQYYRNREGETPMSSIAKRLESWMHIKTSSTIRPNSKLLEIGGGTLNHIKYENNYEIYDVVEPFENLYSNSDMRSYVDNFYSDISLVQNSYDYVFSIATLEHLTDLPRVIAKSATLLRDGGSFLAAIPSEGGLLWGLSWRLSTGIEFYLKYGLDYGNLMHHEHVNNFKEIHALLEIVFKSVERKYFGISGNFSLYQYFECSEPIKEKYELFLN